MDQGWRRLPLLVVFLLLSKNAAGFTYGTYRDANYWLGQPSDNTFSPYAVQSSMPEAPMSGILPEEVGSNLQSKRPLESRSKFNLHQFIKGGVSSSSESTSNAQTAQSPPVSTDVSLPLEQLYLASLSSLQGSSGSSTTDSVGGLVASPSQGRSGPELSGSSKQLLSTQVGGGSYSDVSKFLSALSQYNPESFMNRKLGALPLVASSQPTSAQSLPTLSMSNTQSRSDTQSVAGPFRSSLGGSYASGLLPQSQTASCQSTLGYSKPISSSASSSVHAPSATSFYPSASLSLPQGVASQSSAVQNLRKQFTFTDGSGTQMGSSGPLSFQGSTSYGGSPQPQDIASRFAPGSPTYSSSSLPQDVGSQSATVERTSKLLSSVYGTKAGSLAPFTLLEGPTSSRPHQAQVTTSQFALGYPPSSSESMFSPQAIASQSSTVHDLRKQFTFTGSSGTSPGSSAPLAFQGSTGFGQLPKTQDAYRSSSPYASVSLPQDVTSQFTTGQSTRKGFTSDYGTQAGSSTPFTFLGSTTYSGPLQAQGTSSQLALGYPPSSSASLSSPQGVASQFSAVHGSRKQFALTGNSETQAGSSARITLKGSTDYGGPPQPQNTASHLAPGSLSYPSASPQAYVSKPLSSGYGTQTGSSALLNQLGGTTYGGSPQPQDTASQFAPGSQGFPSSSSTIQGSRKQFTFTGSSSTPAGSFAPLALQRPTGYGQSPKPQDAFRSSPYASVSLPQDVTSQSTAMQSLRKQFTSGYDTQAGPSTPFILHERTGYGGSPQPQDTASLLAPGSLSYQTVLLPQGFVSKQFTSGYGTQTGSSALLALQGSTTYGESPKPQDTASQFIPGSPFYPSASLPQGFPSKSTTAETSRKEFTSGYGTQAGSSAPLTLHRGIAYGGSFQTQDTTNQFAPGTFSYSNALLPQGVGSQSTTVQDSRKQYTSSYGTQTGSTAPFTLQGSTSFGGSSQPQDAKSQFPLCASASFPQGVGRQSTTLQDSRKQFTFTGGSGSQAGTSALFNLHGRTNYGSPQAQVTTSQFAPGSPSFYPSASLSSPQSVASRWKQNFQNFGIAPSQDSSMGGLSSRVSGQSASAPISSIGYGSSSLQSPGHSTKYSTGFPSYVNPGSSSVSSQCTSDQSSTGLFRQERPGAQLDPSSLYMAVQGGASSTDGSGLQRVTSQFAPGLSARDAKVPASSQYSKAVPSGSSPFMTQRFQNWQPSGSR